MELFIKPAYVTKRITKILSHYDAKASRQYEDKAELRKSIESAACYRAYLDGVA